MRRPQRCLTEGLVGHQILFPWHVSVEAESSREAGMWGSETSSRTAVPSGGVQRHLGLPLPSLQNQAHQSIRVLALAFGPGHLGKLLLPEACSLAPFLGVH